MLLLTVVYKSDQKVVKKSNAIEISYDNQDFQTLKKYLLDQIRSPYINLNYEIKKGDSVQKILNKYKLNTSEIQTVINQYKKYANPNQLLIGNKIDIIFEKKVDTDKTSLVKFSIPITKSTSIEIARNEENQITTTKIITKLYKKRA